MGPFESCWQRIKRAEAHYDSLAKTWNRITTRKRLYKAVLNVYVDGTGNISLSPNYGHLLVDKFSLQIGEILYQLRAALDACVYSAAIVETKSSPPPDENKLEFPICASRKEFLKKLTSKLGPLAQKRRDFIEMVQPYNVPQKLTSELLVKNVNRCLGILNDWARKDRHRRLHVVGSWASDAKPKFSCPPGVTVAFLKTASAGLLEHKDEIATFRLDGYKVGMKVEADPDVEIDIAVDEPPQPAADNDTLGNRIAWMIKNTRRVVVTIARSYVEDEPTVDFRWLTRDHLPPVH